MSIHTNVMKDRGTPGSQARGEAERWFARLKAADCSAAERMEFQRWRMIPEHAAAYAETERLWHSLGGLVGRSDMAQLSQQILDETDPARSRESGAWLRRWPAALAASILVVVALTAIVIVRSVEPPAVVYASATGERKVVALADGSQVTLNVASELDVRLSDRRRVVTLRRGEALFAVAPDVRRPFIVRAGSGEVTALGTRFQVRNENEQVTVTLLEGRVAVDRRSTRETTDLAPGDQVDFAADAAPMRQRVVDPQLVSSWTTGRLLFRATRLEEAVQEMNRYSPMQIRIADAAIADIPISGTFVIGDSASVVSALEALLPVRSESSSPTEVRLYQRNSAQTAR